LSALRAEQSQLVNTPEEKAERPEGDRKRESWTERNERMKTEEPEKYAEMQARREEFKAKMEQRSIDRKEFLSEVNIANMSTEQQENHARLVELTEKIDATMKLMMSGEADNSRDLRHEMFESFGELGELYTNERQYLLTETAAAVGYEGDEAALFTAHIEDIIENTSMKPPMMGGRGGRGGDK
jgi:predicted phage gp36 major capsid-like protein